MFRNQYDTDVTVWSPKGRLFQVEYAMEAVNQGSACVGVCSEKYAVIAGLKRSPSELASHQEKVFKIDDHLGIVISGLTADARTLSKYLRDECINHKFVYGSNMPVSRLMARLADKHQQCTQSYIRRPYGVGMLVIGHDQQGAHLFQTCPSGNLYEYHAQAIGARCQSAKTYLEREFEAFRELGLDELIRHALKALASTTEQDKELTVDNTSVGVVGDDQKFTIISGNDLAPYLASLEGGASAAAASETKDDA